MVSLVAAPLSGFLLIAAVIAAIVALHRLKPRAAQLRLPSTLLWERAAQRAGQQQTSWRWWLSLVLSLLIGALLAIMLSRPEVQGAGDASRRTVIVIDNSPSMAARTADGLTRWAHARTVAQGLIREAGGTVMVMDSMGRASPSGFVVPSDALAGLERLAVVPAGRASVPPLPEVAGLEVHVVSDGVANFETPPGAIVHPVFEAADNVAVTSLVTRALPTEPTRVEALVRIVNASVVPKPVRLTLRGAGYSVTQTLQMSAGERIDATFDVSAFEGGVLAAAALSPGDALPGDDIAYAVVDAHRTRHVVLVTRGNPLLADSLAALPGVRVDTIDPGRYRHGMSADAYVFDAFAPPRVPTAGALLFRPTEAAWLPVAARQAGPFGIAEWDRTLALGAGVAWQDVTVTQGVVWKSLPANVRAVVRADAGPLVVSGESGVPWIAVGFRSGDTNLPLQPAFPVFLGQAIARLAAPASVMTEGLGAIRVPLADGEVRNGRGEAVASRPLPGATLFEADRPDIYTVRSPSGRMQVAASVLDGTSVDINRSRFGGMTAASMSTASLPLERWVVIAGIAIALLLIEWAAYSRRVAR